MLNDVGENDSDPGEPVGVLVLSAWGDDPTSIRVRATSYRGMNEPGEVAYAASAADVILIARRWLRSLAADPNETPNIPEQP